MSRKHPIISITGSSGAGTTSVKHIFEQIFRREKVDAAYHRGRRLPPLRPRRRCAAKMAEEAERGNKHFSHFSPETNLFEELEETFRDYGESGTGTHAPLRPRRRGGQAVRRRARHLHRLGSRCRRLRPAVLRRPARRRRHRQGQRRAARRPQDRRRAGHQSRMDPEDPPRPQRRAATPPRR